MTIPNLLTFLRILLIPLFLYYLVQPESGYRWIALLFFALASITDFFDGYLARKLGQDSKLGRFLDPLADKLLVVAAILAFVFLDHQVPLWTVLVIIGRDILITSMRILAIRKGMELRTTRLAKLKTTFQMFSIVIIMIILIVRAHITSPDIPGSDDVMQFSTASEYLKQGMQMLLSESEPADNDKRVFAESIPYFLMVFTALVTIISGIRYLIYNYRILLPPYADVRKKQQNTQE